MRQWAPIIMLLAACSVEVKPPPQAAPSAPPSGVSPAGEGEGEQGQTPPDSGEAEGEGEPPAPGPNVGEGEGEGEVQPLQSCDDFWGLVTDHAGGDVRIDNRTTWEGCHVGIARLVVEATGVLEVAGFGGDAGGTLWIEAEQVEIAGLVTGVGAGHGGGGGGGGSWLQDEAHCPEDQWPRGTPPGSGGGGNAPSAGAPGGDTPAVQGGAVSAPCPGDGGAGGGVGGRPGTSGFDDVPPRAGRGGRGGGAFGGSGGAPGLPPANPQDKPPPGGAGRPGGYQALASNGDDSEDRSVARGSGGGGGGGGAASTGVCRGAGNGGPGGVPGGVPVWVRGLWGL